MTSVFWRPRTPPALLTSSAASCIALMLSLPATAADPVRPMMAPIFTGPAPCARATVGTSNALAVNAAAVPPSSERRPRATPLSGIFIGSTLPSQKPACLSHDSARLAGAEVSGPNPLVRGDRRRWAGERHPAAHEHVGVIGDRERAVDVL